MISSRLGVGQLVEGISALCGARLVLLCFTPEPGTRSDAVGRFLDDVSSSFGGRVGVLCIHPENAPELAHEFAIVGTTTLALFVGGKEAARSVGEGGETMMRKMIEMYAGAGVTEHAPPGSCA